MEAVAAEGICPDAVVERAEQALARDLLIRQDRHAGQHPPQRLARIERQELRRVVVRLLRRPGGGQLVEILHQQLRRGLQEQAASVGVMRAAGLEIRRPAALVGARILVRAPEQEFDHVKAGGGMGRIRAARRLAQCLARDRDLRIADQPAVGMGHHAVDEALVDRPGVEARERAAQ